MKRSVASISVVLAITVIAGGTLWLSRSWLGHETLPAPLPTANLTETAHPQRHDFSTRRRWFGRVESKRSVPLTALVAGRIASREVADGVAVRKGVALFTLGGPRITVRLEALQQQVASLTGRAARAEVIVRLRQQGVQEKLLRREELAAAEVSLAGLKFELATAERQLAAFQASMTVRAPADGVFTNRHVSVGQDVDDGAPLADLIAPDDLRIVARVFPLADVALEGKPVTVRAASGLVVSGTVTHVLPERSAFGATVVWIEGADIARRLEPGETVGGEIVLAVSTGALAVPENAIVRDDREHAFVFLRAPDGWRKQVVTVGRVSAGWVEVVSGVTETDDVVVRGAYELFSREFSRTYTVAD